MVGFGWSPFENYVYITASRRLSLAERQLAETNVLGWRPSKYTVKINVGFR